MVLLYAAGSKARIKTRVYLAKSSKLEFFKKARIVQTLFIPLSEHYQVRRTCTDDFEVNYFIVNHACMTEGHRHGHMCFCETDRCNGADRGGGKSTLVNAVAVAALLANYWGNS